MSQKHQKRLIDHRTKGLCPIINFSFNFNRKHSHLDFETKFAQIRYELTEKLTSWFENWQDDCNFQNFADFRGIDFYNACVLNNMALWRNICQIQVTIATFDPFKLQNTSNTRFGMSPKSSSQGTSNSFQQQLYENARASLGFYFRAHFSGMLDRCRRCQTAGGRTFVP